MITPDEQKIRAYLDDLQELEAKEQARRAGGQSPLSRLRRLAKLRAMELYWTIGRAATNIGAFFFPDHIGPRAKNPKWRRRDISQTSVATAPKASPRLLLDMTSTLRSGKATGIQRVVREIARNAWEMGEGLPVAIHNGGLLPYYRHPEIGEPVAIEPGDVFVMLDASWNHVDEYPPILDSVKAKGGRSIVCLYDILPLTYPNAFPPSLQGRFQAWLDKIVLKSNGVIADSRAAAESLRDHLAARGVSASGLPLGWWRLGADFSNATQGALSSEVRTIAGEAPYFLAVGTMEPRKGYQVILEALEKLWAQGADARFVIVGGRGWGVSVLEARLRGHPEFNRRLFWLDRASDADLALLYRNARALVLASVAEGFGLPIVEAAHYGTPVIATDIAVFREVAGDSASYFTLLDSDSLAGRMKEALADKPEAPVVAPMSWRESATRLLGMARDGGFQSRLD
jgi:glycosyltransferase involved in cell wall biosynthesis